MRNAVGLQSRVFEAMRLSMTYMITADVDVIEASLGWG